MSLQGSSSSLAFSIGVLADPVAALLAWYLLLTFPSGRLTRPARGDLGFAIAFVAIAFVPWFFLSEHVAGATPLARCTAACPTNALMIANRPDVAGHFGRSRRSSPCTFAVGAVALLLVRASRSQAQRAGVPSHPWPRSASCGSGPSARVPGRRIPRGDGQSFWDTVGWILTGARIALPLAFLLALALAQMYAGGALERMMRLRVRPGQAELEQVAAEALGDPALRLALWNPDPEEWIGTGGVVVQPEPQDGRAWRELRSDGRPVAALDYDDVLDEDPELVDAAATAISSASRRRGSTRRSARSRRSSTRRSGARRPPACRSGAGSSATSTTARSSN